MNNIELPLLLGGNRIWVGGCVKKWLKKSEILNGWPLQQRTKLRDGKTTHNVLPLTRSQQAFKKEKQEKAPRAYLEPFS